MNARRTNNPPLFETLLKDSRWYASRREKRRWKETIDIRANRRIGCAPNACDGTTNERLRLFMQNRKKQECPLLSVEFRSTELFNWLGISSLSIGRMFFRFFAVISPLVLSEGHRHADLQNPWIFCSEDIF